MSLTDHRYKVTILKIERTDGEEKEYFDALTYHNLKYDEVLTVQTLMKTSNVEDLLLGAGIATAQANNIDLPPAMTEAAERGKSGRN